MKTLKETRKKIEKEIVSSLNGLLIQHQPKIAKDFTKSVKQHSKQLAKKFVKSLKALEKVKAKAEKKASEKKKKLLAVKPKDVIKPFSKVRVRAKNTSSGKAAGRSRK